jgi:hypothetical protein
MKRLVTAAMLLLGPAWAAHADTSIYTSRHSKSDAGLHAASAACDQQVGPDRNGVATTPQYKRCMASHGWRYQRTIREHSAPREHTWIDPETGDACQDIFCGLGSSCGNF